MLTVFMQIAAKFSTCLGREVLHIKLSEEERVQSFQSMGVPEHLAKYLALIETQSAGGSEERLNDLVENKTGRPPLTFDAWVQQNKATWQ